MPGAGDLYTAAEQLLAAAARALEDAPGGPIDTQAIWTGPPAWDCVPALYVHAGGPVVADTYPLQPPLQPAQRIPTTGLVNMVQFTISVLRCVPTLVQSGQTLQTPSDASISAAAEVTYGDLWTIWNFLINQHRNGNLFQTPSRRREFMLDPAVAIHNSGGIGGWQISVRLQLGGYPAGPAVKDWTP